MTRPDLPGDPWEYATWEGAERAQLLAGAQMSFRDKLLWLEQAAAWVERMESARRQGVDAEPPDSRARG